MKTKLLIPLLLLLAVGAAAQTSKQVMYKDLNRAGAYYWNYPGPSQKALTPAPAGYEPFYISHHGRHGSRYMTDNGYYVYAIEKLDTAAQLGILTPKGSQVLDVLRIGYADARKRDGELSALGGRQHREIAHRMYERFPELLSQPMKVDARSSVYGRCMISMFYFCQELQGLNPGLEIRMDASQRDMPSVIYDPKIKVEEAPGMPELEKQLESYMSKAFKSDRLIKSLFKDAGRARSFVDSDKLVECLYNVAADLQDVPELNLSLWDVFTREELFTIWEYCNGAILLSLGVIPGSTPEYLRQTRVLKSVIRNADRAIAEGKPTLTLRFGHDSSVLPLAYLMGIKEAMGGRADFKNLYKYISLDKLIPMAANIQMVFYRKDGSDDILVKFLMNEDETSIPVKTDVAPYYHWTDVRQYWEQRLGN